MDENKFAQVMDWYVTNEKLYNEALKAVTEEMTNKGVSVSKFDYSGIDLNNGIQIPVDARLIIKGMSQKDEGKCLEEAKSSIRARITDYLKDSNYQL